MAVLRLGDISVNLSERAAHRGDGREIRLTPLEYRILAALARQPERIVTHSTLLKEVWGPDRDDSRSLRVYIGSLRRKLEADPSRPKHILTELGLGYRLVLDQEARIEIRPTKGASWSRVPASCSRYRRAALCLIIVMARLLGVIHPMVILELNLALDLLH